PRSAETGQSLPSPTYAEIGNMVRLLDGEPVKRVRKLMNTIFEQDVSCVPVLDWSDPEQWIEDRLTGELRVLARKIWLGSDEAINPASPLRPCGLYHQTAPA